MITAPLIKILRHRMAIDGQGVTTLVALWGCPLKCKYCINGQYLTEEYKARCIDYTPEALLDDVMIDDLYFKATLGGITFGGGEPMIHADFIREFAKICPEEWRITVETSLNISRESIETVKDYVHDFRVDIKDLNPETYKAYTGVEQGKVMDNLDYLLHNYDGDIHVRVPQIAQYNTKEDCDSTCRYLIDKGFKNIERLEYIVVKERKNEEN